MYDHISMAEAADRLVHAGRVKTLARARKAIVAALMLELFPAHARAYSVTASPSPAEFAPSSHIHKDCCVPFEFWRLEHQFDFGVQPGSGGLVPSGQWANWQASSFSVDLSTSGRAAAARFVEFQGFASLGERPVEIEWTAIGVTMHPTDLEHHLIEGQRLESLIARVNNRPAPRFGNVSSSDLDLIKARFCVHLLRLVELPNWPELNKSDIFDLMIESSALLQSDLTFKDDNLRKFAQLVADVLASDRERYFHFPPS